MPYVQPAVLIDSGLMVYWPVTVNGWQGPVRRGTEKWLPSANSLLGATDNIFFYLSTDGGITWVAQDADNAPVMNEYALAYDALGDQWYVANSNLGATVISFRIFSLSSRTYGAEVASLTVSAAASNYGLFLYPGGSGAFIFVYLKYVSSTSQRLCFDTWNGTTWGGEVVVSTGDYGRIIAAVMDGADRLHIFTTRYSGSVLHPYYEHVSIESDRTYGSSQVILHGEYLGANWGNAIYAIDSDEIIISLDLQNAYKSGVYRGVAGSSPTFAYEDIASWADDGGYPVWVILAVPEDGDYSTLYSFFAFGGGDLGWSYLYESHNSGAGWSDPALFYDCIADPPVLLPGWTLDGFDHHSASIFKSGTTTWAGIAQGGLLQNPENGACNILFYVEGGLGDFAIDINDSFTLSDALIFPLWADAADSFELLDYVTRGLHAYEIPDLADQMTMLDLVRISLTRGSKPIILIYEGCDTPENARDSIYCKGFKDYRTNTLEEIDPCDAIVYEIGEEVECIPIP